MGFAERNGFVKEKTVQVDEIDRSLRNRLYNMVHRFREFSNDTRRIRICC